VPASVILLLLDGGFGEQPFSEHRQQPTVAADPDDCPSGSTPHTEDLMLVTNHVLSGALIGHVARRIPVSFAVGVLSHLVLDATPHWGDARPIQQLMHIAVPDGLVGAATMALVTLTTHPERRTTVLAGMAGAALLDLDKPGRVFFGASPFPRFVDAVHGGVQHESPRRMPQELAVGLSLMVVVALITRRHRG
jgi:hypothetical protein